MSHRKPSAIFHGWWIVLTAAVGVFWGVPVIVYTFSVFVKPFAHDFHAGRAAVSLAYTLESLAAAVCAPLAGWLVDRYGARNIILPGIATFATVLIFNRSVTGSLWRLYFFYAIIGILLNSVGPTPYGKVISHWFDRRRGLALGLTMLGIGAGGIILPPFAQALITRFNWHLAFTILGAAVLLISLPLVAAFLKESPQDLGLLPDGTAAVGFTPDEASRGMSARDARHTRTFWLMLCAFFLVGATVQGCVVHMAAMIVDRGATVQTAALGSSVIGVAVLIGRAGTGYLLDRLFAPVVACFLFGSVGAGIALLLTSASIPFAFAGAFLIGLGLGAEIDIIAYLISRYFGMRNFGQLVSLAFGAFVLSGALGALAMGAGFDLTGSYRVPLAALFGATCVAIMLMTRLGPYGFGAPQPVENQQILPARVA
jgi:MFS family permease